MLPYSAILAPPTIRSPAQNHVEFTVLVQSSPCVSSLRKTSFHVDWLLPLWRADLSLSALAWRHGCDRGVSQVAAVNANRTLSRIEDLAAYAPPRRIMRYAVNRRVDADIESLPGWYQRSVAACNFVHVAASVVVKTIKRTKRPYVERQGKRAGRSSPLRTTSTSSSTTTAWCRSLDVSGRR